MGIRSIFLGASYKDEAIRLVGGFATVCPPPERVGTKAPSDKMVAKALDDLSRQTLEFSDEHRLGVIGRARLAKAFQDEMLRMGYPADLVSRITSSLTFNALIKKPR